MGALTEREIFDCLASNLAEAVTHCEALARIPKKGPTYNRLRNNLKLIEGCCRQAAYWRSGDARWLKLGLLMSEAHKRAGTWLRSYVAPASINEALHPSFCWLADRLRELQRVAETLRTHATGRAEGPILPRPLPGPHRDTKPVGYRVNPGERLTRGGVIIPAGAS